MSAARSAPAGGTIGAGSACSSSAKRSVVTTSASPAASRALSASSGLARIRRAPESETMCASSTGGSRKIAGVTTAPARQTALYAIDTSGQFAISTTTRSPGRTPRSISAPASLVPRSCSSPERCQRPSNQSDSRSP